MKYLQELLTDTYKDTRKMTGLDPRNIKQYPQMVANPNAFAVYKAGLCEGLNEADGKVFNTLMDNMRLTLMENSMFQVNPYETLMAPILRVFYPKLIAKELVNLIPITKPEVVLYFIKSKFSKTQAGGTATGYNYDFPSVNTDITRGIGSGVVTTGDSTGSGTASTNILTAVGLTNANAHIERDFILTGVTDSTGDVTVVIRPTVDGTFSTSVTLNDDTTAVVSGHIDYLNGILYWSASTTDVTGVKYRATVSLEENQINPTMKFDMEKINLRAVDRRISAEFTTNLETDVRALFDINLQAELINIGGEQMALDLDREIITALIDANTTYNNASTHTASFYKTPPTEFTWGQKLWFENIIPTLNELSANVYNSCLMGSANTLACNPVDAAIFQSLNTFEYVGDAATGGDVGYRTATVAGGQWKILTSNIVPKGSIIAKYRNEDPMRAAFVYAPYVPCMLSPYPLGAIPSLTIQSRYATRVVRPEAIAVLTVHDGAEG